MKSPMTWITVATTATLLAACAGERKPPALSPVERPARGPDAGQVTQPATATVPVGGLRVDPEIAAACDLPQAYFAFDSAELSSAATSALDALARCFTTGPMAERRMLLVGHADPRGETHYNIALGHRRAASVEAYLTSRGMAGERIEVSSVGELEASGTDEASWALDRRVEVLLDDGEPGSRADS